MLNYTLHTGFRTGPNARFADDHVCAQAYLAISPLFEQSEILEPTIKAFDIMLNDPKPGREDWWWCDALLWHLLVLLLWLKLLANDVIWIICIPLIGMLLNIYVMLKLDFIFRDHRYIPDGQGNEMREANGEKVFWSRGIGWVLASIPRILQYMPDDYHERDRYITLFKTISAFYPRLPT